MSPLRSSLRSGTLYILGWVPLLALFSLVFSATGFYSLAQALGLALMYTLPPALCGIGVIRACLTMPWPPASRAWFLARHIGLAAVFVIASGTSSIALFNMFPVIPEDVVEAEGEGLGLIVFQLFLGTLIYCVVVGFTYAVMGEERRRQQAAAAAKAEALRAQAELKALRAQVNPHFLFNTLHSLLALVRKDAGAAEEALDQFGGLMRYALRAQQEIGDHVRFAEEWGFAQDYLALERLRLGDRLVVHTQIDEAALAASVPAFSLQPLLENSIGHAIAPRARGGNVWIRATAADGRFNLEVRDDGDGADEEAILSSAGSGLRLLRRRLAALHGETASITTRADEGGFAVIVELPADHATEAAEGSGPARRPVPEPEP